MTEPMTWYDRWLLFGSNSLVPAERDFESLPTSGGIQVFDGNVPTFLEPSTVTQPAFCLNWIVEEKLGICVVNANSITKVNLELSKNSS